MAEESNTLRPREPLINFAPHFQNFYKPTVWDGITMVHNHDLDNHRYAAGMINEKKRLYYPSVTGAIQQHWENLNNQTYQNLIAFLKKDDPDYFTQYWGLHTDSYLQRLDQLIKPVKPEFINASTKAVIAIAAMNETELSRTLDVIKKSYGERFEEEVGVVIYHNFKDEPDDEVKASVKAAASYSNVSVLEEEVPSENNVGMAKKVASDIVLRAMTQTKRVPLIMMDADIVGMTPGMIKDAIQALAAPETLAVSPNFTFDPEASKRFPVLGLAWDLEKHLAFAKDVTAIEKKFTIGAFTAIQPQTLVSLGGYLPAPMEDMLLSDRLTGSIQPERSKSPYPIDSLDEKKHIITVDASRQIYNLSKQRSANSHWLGGNKEYAVQVGGSKRFNWKDLEPVPDEIAELGEYNPVNLKKVLDSEWQKKYQSISSVLSGAAYPKEVWLKYKNAASREFLLFLKNKGLDVSVSILQGQDVSRVMFADESLSLSGSDWQVYSIKEVRFI